MKSMRALDGILQGVSLPDACGLRGMQGGSLECMTASMSGTCTHLAPG